MSKPTILNVPFAEKDEAKALGARWDPKLKKWYVPVDVDISQFDKWMLEENEYALSPIFIVKSAQACWKCDQISDVYCIASSGLIDEDGSENYFTLFSNLDFIDAKVEKTIKENFPTYSPDYSKTAGGVYYMNHCQNCSTKMGDFFMHSEPEGAFFPTSVNSALRITLFKLTAVDGEIAINGSPGYQSPDFISQYAEIKEL